MFHCSRRQPVAADCRFLQSERERNLGSHQDERMPVLRVVLQMIGEEDYWGNADAAAYE
jgi:hypothetical protein